MNIPTTLIATTSKMNIPTTLIATTAKTYVKGNLYLYGFGQSV
jgi:hypothetical protein